MLTSKIHGSFFLIHKSSQKFTNLTHYTVTEKGGKIPPWGGMQQIFHPHVTKGGEEGGKLLFSTITWWKT